MKKHPQPKRSGVFKFWITARSLREVRRVAIATPVVRDERLEFNEGTRNARPYEFKLKFETHR